ncbi:Uma2 family endonuclease [Alsobacter sp. KACC 23698]|uniref:Uma2 family endonuclease n=1 Tax=Alsobacter sp. KACC 23698 TaxID=3149229 RepID=A0AAU7JA16_9HYPH
MNIRTAPPMDKATFYRWLERQERRWELADGVPRMLPWVTSNHARICTNLVAWLAAHLDRDVHDIMQGDFAIETGPRSVRFADVMVCPFVQDPKGRHTVVAPLVVEVLSESTEHVAFGEKLIEYGALDGVDAYMICAQDKAAVWLWLRDPQEGWPKDPEILNSLDGSARLPHLRLDLPLAEIYRRVTVA